MKYRYTYFEKSNQIVYIFFKDETKGTLFIFLPYLNFYEIWNNKTPQQY